jgi:hypothetical protein
MTIGPVQLLVLGFSQPDFQGEIRQELERLRDNDLVRVIDALAVHKDAEGNVSKLQNHPLWVRNRRRLPSTVALSGLRGLSGVT